MPDAAVWVAVAAVRLGTGRRVTARRAGAGWTLWDGGRWVAACRTARAAAATLRAYGAGFPPIGETAPPTRV